MFLQRIHDRAHRCTGVRVKHTGLSPEQNFSHRLIEQAMAEGWVVIDGDTLTMQAKPEALRFRLRRVPGYYCISTGERIPVSDIAWTRMRSTGLGDLSRKEALAWLLARGRAQTDYEVTNAYECVLDEEQHAKYRAVKAPTGLLTSAGD